MKNSKSIEAKKLTVIILTVVFALFTILSLSFLTIVRKVEVSFATCENVDCNEVQSVLDQYVGKHFLFVGSDEIEQALSKFSYVKTLSVKKSFPNVIKVSVIERKEVYSVETQDKVLILDEEGYLLAEKPKEGFSASRSIINLDLGNVLITNAKLGQYLQTDSKQLFDCVLKMASGFNLSDCIKGVSIQKYDAPNELSDVIFSTYTGADICVYKAEQMGEKKIKRAFEIYDKKVSDYEKAYGILYVYNYEDDLVEIVWSEKTNS